MRDLYLFPIYKIEDSFGYPLSSPLRPMKIDEEEEEDPEDDEDFDEDWEDEDEE